MIDENLYYSPEAFGLTVVAEIDYSDGDYNFDHRVVWKDNNNIFYTGRNAGCSCPSPFEDIHDVSELDRLDINVLEAELREENSSSYSHITVADAQDFITNVRVAWNEAGQV